MQLMAIRVSPDDAIHFPTLWAHREELCRAGSVQALDQQTFPAAPSSGDQGHAGPEFHGTPSPGLTI